MTLPQLGHRIKSGWPPGEYWSDRDVWDRRHTGYGEGSYSAREPRGMAKEREHQRKFRMTDTDWTEVRWAVQVRGDRSVSYIIRTLLTQYVQETKMMARQARVRQRSEHHDGARRSPPGSRPGP